MLAEAYDFWLFDLDGTLVDTRFEYARRVFDEVGERLGRQFSDREVEVVWHGLGGRRNASLRGMGVDPEAFWPALDDAQEPAARAAATYLHDDADRLLAALDRPVGVVTHCPAFLADPVLERLDLRERLDAVVICGPETGWKPDPAPVERAADRLGAEGRGVMAGDGAGDVGAAWNAGLDAVHVERHGPERRGRCVLADYRVRALDDLLGREPAPAAADD